MPTARVAVSSHDAFLRGLSEITKDKRLTAVLTDRFDEHVNAGGDPRSMATNIFFETAAEGNEPDAKYYDAEAAYDDATGRVPLSDRDVKRHPGKRRVSTADFVDKEYNPFKTRTDGRLGSVESRLKQLDGAESLLQQLAASELANTVSRAEVIRLRQEFANLERGYARTQPAAADDPAVSTAKDEKRADLDERFKAVYKAAADLVEATDRDVATLKKRVDAHDGQIEQHDVMLREHDAVITTVKSGSDSTIIVALIALGAAIVFGLIAFMIKLDSIVPDVSTQQTIRGVTVKEVHDYSQLNGFWPAVLVGLLVGSIVFVIVCIAGFASTNHRSDSGDDSDESTTTKKYAFFKRVDAKEKQATPVEANEPDHVDAVHGMFHEDTKPVTARV